MPGDSEIALSRRVEPGSQCRVTAAISESGVTVTVAHRGTGNIRVRAVLTTAPGDGPTGQAESESDRGLGNRATAVTVTAAIRVWCGTHWQ